MDDRWNFDRTTEQARHPLDCSSCCNWLDHLSSGAGLPSFERAMQARATFYQARYSNAPPVANTPCPECQRRLDDQRVVDDLRRQLRTVTQERDDARRQAEDARRQAEDARRQAEDERKQADVVRRRLDELRPSQGMASVPEDDGQRRRGRSRSPPARYYRPQRTSRSRSPRRSDTRAFLARRRSPTPPRARMRSPPPRKSRPSSPPRDAVARDNRATRSSRAERPLAERIGESQAGPSSLASRLTEPLAKRLSSAPVMQETGGWEGGFIDGEWIDEEPDFYAGMVPLHPTRPRSDSDDEELQPGQREKRARDQEKGKRREDAEKLQWHNRSEWHRRMENSMTTARQIEVYGVRDVQGIAPLPTQGCTPDELMRWHHFNGPTFVEWRAHVIDWGNQVENWANNVIHGVDRSKPPPMEPTWTPPPPVTTPYLPVAAPPNLEADAVLWRRYPLLRPANAPVSQADRDADRAQFNKLKKGQRSVVSVRSLENRARDVLKLPLRDVNTGLTGEGTTQVFDQRRHRFDLTLPDPDKYEEGLLWLRADGSTRAVTSIHQLRWPRTEQETRRLVAEALRPQRWVALEKVLQFMRASIAGQINTEGAEAIKRIYWKRPSWAVDQSSPPEVFAEEQAATEDDFREAIGDQVSAGEYDDGEVILDPPLLSTMSFKKWRTFMNQHRQYAIPGVAGARDSNLSPRQTLALIGFLRVMEMGPTALHGPSSYAWLFHVLEIETLDGERYLHRIESLAVSTSLPQNVAVTADTVRAHLHKTVEDSKAHGQELNQWPQIRPIRVWAANLHTPDFFIPSEVRDLPTCFGPQDVTMDTAD